jgi:hypothetical protein
MPAPVLDYAPASRTPVRDFLRRLRVAAIVLGVGLLCGAWAFIAQPPKYTASACVQLVMAWDSGNWTAEEVKGWMDKHLAALSQPPAPDARPYWTPDQFRRRIGFKPLAGISSQAITFTDTDPKRAADTVNGILDRHIPPPGRPWKEGDLLVAWRAVPPSPAQGKRSWGITGIGFGVGLVGAAIVAWVVARRSRIRALAGAETPA